LQNLSQFDKIYAKQTASALIGHKTKQKNTSLNHSGWYNFEFSLQSSFATVKQINQQIMLWLNYYKDLERSTMLSLNYTYIFKTAQCH